MIRRVRALLAIMSGVAAFVLVCSCGGGTGEVSTQPTGASISATVKAQAVAVDYTSVVQYLYVSYYGRPGDPAGMSFWAGYLAQNNAPTDIAGFNAAYASNPAVKAVMDNFGNSEESRALFGTDNTAIVTAIYWNLYNRAPDAPGLAFWVNGLNQGKISPAQAAMTIAAGAQGSDITAVHNKVSVASQFTSALTSAQASAYSGMAIVAQMRTQLGSVGISSNLDAATAALLAVVGSSSAAPFDGSILLGAPTETSVQISVLSTQQNGRVFITYGRQAGQVEDKTSSVDFSAGTPAVLALANLSPSTRYYYRLNFSAADAIASTDEYTFRTARAAGEAFVFTIQADSHMDGNSSLDQYLLTLSNVLADGPDFHVDLGDTFMTEKYSTPLTATSVPAPDLATVVRRYRYERGNYGHITSSVPLFLVNGNHDGELGWMRNGTPNTIPVWATQARKQFFLNPTPNSFYSGDSYQDPTVGQRAAWYSWNWGDALFIVLDPYWNSPAQANQSSWNLTLGAAQYQWLSETLSRSSARYKFVFLHNLVGGLDGQMRGGIEAAPYFEWGGKNLDGSDGFASRRPGWSMPIHALLVKNNVTAVFKGHDHIYVRQSLDGIVYQTVPQPSAANTSNGPSIAQSYHYASGTIVSSSGHVRVTVTRAAVTSEYVRAWLPAVQTAKQQNGEIADRWSVQGR